MAITEPSPGTLDVPQIPAPPAPPAPEPSPDLFPYPPTDLIESDGVPLESDWHVNNINLLCDVVDHFLHDRDDYYVGGNMFIYFCREEARNRDFRGPDFFFVNRLVSRTPVRRYWAVWDEHGRYPDVIIELMSPTTKKEDLTSKKDIYEKIFRTHEYYCYDPETQELLGWRLQGTYQPIAPNDNGWLWSEQLGLWLGTWMGLFKKYVWLWLRFYDRTGMIVPTYSETDRAKAEAETKRADAEYKHAQTERQRADAEHQRAEAEKLRADAESERALALEAEIAALKSQLASRTPPTS